MMISIKGFCLISWIVFIGHFSWANEKLEGEHYSSTYDNQVLKSKGVLRSEKMQGTWTRWYPNGQMESLGGWVNDLPDGHWIFWYPSGQKNAEGEMALGRRVGQWTFWDIDGNSEVKSFSHPFWQNFHAKNLRVELEYISQNDLGSLNSFGIYWSPMIDGEDFWNYRWLAGYIPAKTVLNSSFTILDFEFLAIYGPFSKRQLFFEFGGGYQSWSLQATNPLVLTANLSTSVFDNLNLGRPVLGLSYLSNPNGVQTLELKLGTYIKF